MTDDSNGQDTGSSSDTGVSAAADTTTSMASVESAASSAASDVAGQYALSAEGQAQAIASLPMDTGPQMGDQAMKTDDSGRACANRGNGVVIGGVRRWDDDARYALNSGGGAMGNMPNAQNSAQTNAQAYIDSSSNNYYQNAMPTGENGLAPNEYMKYNQTTGLLTGDTSGTNARSTPMFTAAPAPVFNAIPVDPTPILMPTKWPEWNEELKAQQQRLNILSPYSDEPIYRW